MALGRGVQIPENIRTAKRVIFLENGLKCNLDSDHFLRLCGHILLQIQHFLLGFTEWCARRLLKLRLNFRLLVQMFVRLLLVRTVVWGAFKAVAFLLNDNEGAVWFEGEL